VDRPRRTDLLTGFPERLKGDRWQPALDVIETEKAVVVRVELAGVASPDVRVTVDGDRLSIRGERKLAPPSADAEVQRLHQMEIAYGPFERSLKIQIPFDRDQVVASLEEGVLSVFLPKQAPARRSIEVKGEPGDE